MASRISAPRMIDRQRVTRLLQETLATSHVLLTAPAGYGKSVALRQLTAYQPDTHLLSLTPADVDPAVLESRIRPLLDRQNTVLVDDVHLLDGANEVCTWLQQQMDQPWPRWLLAGRRLPFDESLLTIAGQATLLTRDDLAFSLSEAQILLGADDAQVAGWHEKLHGWSLALSLLSRLSEDDDPLPAAEAHLFQYLAASVFDRLPKVLQSFMETTAVPLRFNLALAQMIWPDAGQAEALLDEVSRRNLYLQPAEESGWLRYHDLIREFLLQRASSVRAGVGQSVVAWHLAQDDRFRAIEQSLDSGLTRQAADLLAGMKLTQFHTENSYLTYRRWIHALDDDALSQHPMLLVRLSNILGLSRGYAQEALATSQRAIRLASAQGNSSARLLAEANLALQEKYAGHLEKAQARILRVLAEPDCINYARMFSLRIAGLIHGDLGLYRNAGRFSTEAIPIAPTVQAVNEPFMNRANRMLHCLLPLGRFADAWNEIQAVLSHFGDTAPGWRVQYLAYVSELHTQQGDWAGLEATVAESEEVMKLVELPTVHVQMWRLHYLAVLAVVDGDDERVESALAEYRALAESFPLHLSLAHYLAVWHLRRKNRLVQAMERAETLLDTGTCTPAVEPHVGLERDIAQGLLLLNGERDSFALHPATRSLITRRMRPQIVRLRALLAVVCYGCDEPGWQRHWRSARRSLEEPGYEGLLTTLDPQLGTHFWLLPLATGMEDNRAIDSLQAIDGGGKQVMTLLAHENPTVRQRGAEALRACGTETDIPALAQAVSAEKSQQVKKVLTSTLETLFSQPPPRLSVQLLGGFSLTRGGEPVPDDAWNRPVVQRLFQYFAVNAGAPVSKDRLLDDLWPDTDPSRGWRNFRTVHSLLRKVLEPFMPPKAPNRYFTITGETYTFDATGMAEIDFVVFRERMRASLRDGNVTGAVPLDENFLAVLESYGPLLPDLPYEEWLLAARQETEALYVEASHFAAQNYLAQGEFGEAIAWSERVVQTAPWHEDAHQTLMRCYARLGQRSTALHIYQQAIERLQQELGAEPSSVTVWLAERLRNGEEI